MKRALLLLSTVLFLPASIAAADAHAFLDHAVPAVGSSVRSSPGKLKLWFTQRLEPEFSTVQVQDPAGKRVDKGDGQVDVADETLLQVSLPPLAPGKYRVTWRVLSVDTHVTEGDFMFDVAP